MATTKTDTSTKPTRKTYAGFRPLIVLVGYAISTLFYFLAIRIAPSSSLGVFPPCMLAFLLPDLMAIKLLGSPHPVAERFLLNLVGPWSTAIVLIQLFDKTTVSRYRHDGF